MPFLDSLDIANRTCQHVGVTRIQAVDEDSKQNSEIAFVYDKVRRAELRRNVWRFAIKKAVLRPLTSTTMLLAPEAWADDATYQPGAIVSDANGILWVSTKAENVGNDPSLSYVWDQYFGPMTADAWDSSTTYWAGELVYVVTGDPGAYVVFASLQNDNSDNPTTTAAWSSTETYGLDEMAYYSGKQWRSLILFNTNVTPAEAPLDFDPTSIYVIGNQVTASDGFIYTSATNANTGSDPTTDGGTHWTNTTVPKAWTAAPSMFASSPKWLPIYGGLTNLTFTYPVGAGPNSQSSTRNAYRLPAGFLREAPQDPKAGSVSYLGASSARGYDDWTFDGEYLITSQSGVIMFRFVADMNDVTKMDDMFCEGLAARMGMEVCEPLTQSNAKYATIAAAYRGFMGEARLVNGIETGTEELPEDDWITCRL